MRHRAFAARWQPKSKRTLFVCSRHSRHLGALPCPGQALFKPMPGDGKRRWKSGRVKPARASGSPRCAGVHSVRNVSAGPVQPPGRQCPGFHMMESCAAIRIPCFTRHCFRAASPPIPVHGSRLQESTRQAHETRSGRLVVIARARPPSRTAARQNSLFRFHLMPTYGRYRHSRHSLTYKKQCQPPSPAPPCPLPLRSGYAPFPVVCRNVYLLSPSGALAKKPQKA